MLIRCTRFRKHIRTEFKDQLERSPEGWYQTGLILKAGIPDLPSNESGSKARLKKLVQRLEKEPELYDKYEEIIKEQEKEGIIERAPETSTAKEFYLGRRPLFFNLGGGGGVTIFGTCRQFFWKSNVSNNFFHYIL